jgi:tetratricopeptide (TPR) repeat protein
MGVVYEAEDLKLPRHVALKFCSAAQDPQLRAALLNEARALCSLTHPNIAEVYELDQTVGGEPFIAMELLPGALDGELRRGRLGVRRSVRTVTAVAKALEHAHNHGVVHRDIKPSNVRMTEAGQIKVTDFGIADTILRAAAEASTPSDGRTATIARVQRGTPGFMPPEVINGDSADGRSDLFALGCVLYECLTGKQPFRGKTAPESEANVLRVDPPRPSMVDPAVWPKLDLITLKLLEKRPEERYQSAGEVVAALEAVDEPPVPRPPPWYRRRTSAYGAAAVFILLAVFGYWMFRRRPYTPRPEAVPWYQNGLGALADGTYYKATKLFGKAVSIDPDYAMAHAHLAEAWDELEYSKEASQELLKAMTPDSMARISGLDALHLRAIRASVTGDMSSAVKYFRELASKSSPANRTEALLDLGRVLERAQRPAEALAVYTQVTQVSPQSAAGYLRLGSMYGVQRDRAKAAAALDVAQKLYEASTNTEGETECLYYRARNELDPARKRELLRDALNDANATRNDQQVFKILILTSEQNEQEDKKEQALADARKAQQVAERSGLETLKARALIDVSILLSNDAGKEPLQQAVDIGVRTGAKMIEARARANLADLLEYEGDTAGAAAQAEPAFEIYSRAGHLGAAAKVAVILARCDQSQGDFEAALHHYNTALERLGSGGSNTEIALNYEGIAEIMRVQGRLPESIATFQTARKAFEADKNVADTVNTTAAMAEVSGLLGRAQSARSLIQEAREMASGAADKSLDAVVDMAAASAEVADGKNTAALKHIQRAIGSGNVIRADDRFKADVTLALALSRLGRNGEAKTVCDRILTKAAGLSNPALKMQGVLAAAETALRSGRGQDAGVQLGSLLPSIQKIGARDQEWRGWALLSKIATGQAAVEAAAKGREAFRKVTEAWDEGDRKSYSARPDISWFSKLLG